MEAFACTPLVLRLALFVTCVIGLVLASVSASQRDSLALGLAIVFGISCSANLSFAAFSIRPKCLRLSVDAENTALTVLAAAIDAALGVTLTVLHAITVVDGSSRWSGLSVLTMYASFLALVACTYHFTLSLVQIHQCFKAWYQASVTCPACSHTFLWYGTNTQPSGSPKESPNISLYISPNEEGEDEGDRLIQPAAGEA